jgi:hypothetical protein
MSEVEHRQGRGPAEFIGDFVVKIQREVQLRQMRHLVADRLEVNESVQHLTLLVKDGDVMTKRRREEGVVLPLLLLDRQPLAARFHRARCRQPALVCPRGQRDLIQLEKGEDMLQHVTIQSGYSTLLRGAARRGFVLTCERRGISRRCCRVLKFGWSSRLG